VEQTWTPHGFDPDPVREFLAARFDDDLRWAADASAAVAERLRAEVEAKRLVINAHGGFKVVATDEAPAAWFCSTCVITTFDDRDLPVEDWEYEPHPCRILRGYAWVYRDHPDWRPGWEISAEDEHRSTFALQGLVLDAQRKVDASPLAP